jgi:hypothetical protein
MQAKHKNTGRWEGVKPRLSHFQVYLTAKKCGPGGGRSEAPAVVPHPPTPGGVGGGLGGARSSLAMPNTQHPQHPRNGFWLGVGWAKSVEFSKVK